MTLYERILDVRFAIGDLLVVVGEELRVTGETMQMRAIHERIEYEGVNEELGLDRELGYDDGLDAARGCLNALLFTFAGAAVLWALFRSIG